MIFLIRVLISDEYLRVIRYVRRPPVDWNSQPQHSLSLIFEYRDDNLGNMAVLTPPELRYI